VIKLQVVISCKITVLQFHNKSPTSSILIRQYVIQQARRELKYMQWL